MVVVGAVVGVAVGVVVAVGGGVGVVVAVVVAMSTEPSRAALRADAEALDRLHVDAQAVLSLVRKSFLARWKVQDLQDAIYEMLTEARRKVREAEGLALEEEMSARNKGD